MFTFLVWLFVLSTFSFALVRTFNSGVRKTVDSLGVALVVDRQLKVLYASRAAEDVLIDSKKSEQLIALLREQSSSFLSEPKSYSDKQIRYSPIRYKGKASWLVQIDEELFSENQKADSLDLINTIIQAIPDAVGMMNHNLVYEACNQAFVEPLGIKKPEDLLGKKLQDVAPREIVEKFAFSDARVLKSGEAFFIIDEFVDKEGNKRWVDARKFRFVNPQTKKPGLFILARDITDIELAKKDLNEAKNNFQKLSMIDALTQIGNRRMFNEHLAAEWKNHARNVKPFSLIMCDIDKFKSFNDTYGHVFGDEVLVVVAETLKMPLKRPLDRVYRYGGEEFAFILCDTDSEGAKSVADRVHCTLKTIQVEYEGKDIKQPLTVSLGVYTCYPKIDEDPMDAIQLVDEALYKAKEEGRDQTVFVGKWHQKELQKELVP